MGGMNQNEVHASTGSISIFYAVDTLTVRRNYISK